MKYDDYAFKLLVENQGLRKILKGKKGQVFGQYYETCEYEMLKLFFMSVLLRAGLSSDFFFQHVKLGPYVKVLKKAILSADAKKADDFSVFLGYYKQVKNEPIIFPPARQRIGGITFYNFHLGRVLFWVKVDKRDTPEELKHIMLKPGGKLFLVEFDLRNSNASELLTRAVNNRLNSRYFSLIR